MNGNFIKQDADVAWCPGCGNFAIRKTVGEAVQELELDWRKIVMVSGIGQAAKAPQYLNANYFNGLHGRALPAATGIKAANPELTVIVESGDGDMYGEGGNHFLHAIRRNPDITVIVHNNMVYGLTKGQASPTSQRGMKTPVQVNGVFSEPFNPLATAVAMDASFVARANAGAREETKMIIKEAVQHKGFALVDVFQPCVTFNKLNTYNWFRDNTYSLADDHDPGNREKAFSRAIESDKLPLGIFYRNSDKTVFEDNCGAYQTDPSPLFRSWVDHEKIEDLIRRKRG
ncbi:MAG: thiamine pyrophosphate-dependent enzyme [Lentisphaeria bacterium]